MVESVLPALKDKERRADAKALALFYVEHAPFKFASYISVNLVTEFIGEEEVAYLLDKKCKTLAAIRVYEHFLEEEGVLDLLSSIVSSKIPGDWIALDLLEQALKVETMREKVRSFFLALTRGGCYKAAKKLVEHFEFSEEMSAALKEGALNNRCLKEQTEMLNLSEGFFGARSNAFYSLIGNVGYHPDFYRLLEMVQDDKLAEQEKVWCLREMANCLFFSIRYRYSADVWETVAELAGKEKLSPKVREEAERICVWKKMFEADRLGV